jgi:hypothetical protein
MDIETAFGGVTTSKLVENSLFGKKHTDTILISVETPNQLHSLTYS